MYVRLQAFGRLDADGSRYLLGDDLGNMYLLVLAHNGEAVMGLKMEIIGEYFYRWFSGCISGIPLSSVL